LIDVLWDVYLWEISLATIRKYETSGQQRFTLSLGSGDPTWQLLAPTQSLTGDTLVREFMKTTSAAYGSDINYVMRLKNRADTGQDVFMHYSQLFGNLTFTDFMYGRLVQSAGPDLLLDDTSGLNMLNMRWWSDQDAIISMQLDASKTQKTDYRLPIPTDEANRSQYLTDMQNRSHYVWDTVRSLAGAYLPEEALQYLAPRTLNKIVESLDIDTSQYSNAQRAEDYSNLETVMRRITRNHIEFNF